MSPRTGARSVDLPMGRSGNSDIRGALTTRTYDALGRPATIVTPNVQNAVHFRSARKPDLAVRFGCRCRYQRDVCVRQPQPAYFGVGALTAYIPIRFARQPDIPVRILERLPMFPDPIASSPSEGLPTDTTATATSRPPALPRQVAYYTPFGMPYSVTSNATTPSKGYFYEYDGNHQRVIERRVQDSFISATYYFSDGNTPFFEEERDSSNPDFDVVTWKHYVNTPEGVTELIVVKGDAAGTRSDRL